MRTGPTATRPIRSGCFRSWLAVSGRARYARALLPALAVITGVGDTGGLALAELLPGGAVAPGQFGDPRRRFMPGRGALGHEGLVLLPGRTGLFCGAERGQADAGMAGPVLVAVG